jgi:hypothetical protein
MTKNKKFLTAGIAVAVCATVAIGATLAYLNSTQTVVNNLTFVPGATMAALTEPTFSPGDALNLEPGTTVQKNPQITNIVGLTIGDATDPNGLNTVTGSVIAPDGSAQSGNLSATDKSLKTPSSDVTEFAMLQLEFQGVDASGNSFDLQPWQINELMQVISFTSTSTTVSTPTAGLDTTDWTLDTSQAVMDTNPITSSDVVNYSAAMDAVAAPYVTATPNYVDYVYNTALDSYYTDGQGSIVNNTPGTTHPLFDSFTVNASASDAEIADVLAWAPGGVNIVCNAAVIQTDNLAVGDTDTTGTAIPASALVTNIPAGYSGPLVSDLAVSQLEALLPIANTSALSSLPSANVASNKTALTFAVDLTTANETSVPATMQTTDTPPVTLYTTLPTTLPIYDTTAVPYSATNYTPDIPATSTAQPYAPDTFGDASGSVY